MLCFYNVRTILFRAASHLLRSRHCKIPMEICSWDCRESTVPILLSNSFAVARCIRNRRPVFCPIRIGHVLTEHAIEENIQVEVLVFEHVAESDDNFRVGTSQIDSVGCVYFPSGCPSNLEPSFGSNPFRSFTFICPGNKSGMEAGGVSPICRIPSDTHP